jgi:hypothetical protein
VLQCCMATPSASQSAMIMVPLGGSGEHCPNCWALADVPLMHELGMQQCGLADSGFQIRWKQPPCCLWAATVVALSLWRHTYVRVWMSTNPACICKGSLLCDTSCTQ